MFDRGILLQVLWTSLATASFQVLLTIAFALILKVTKIWNFTQPALMGVAFYAMYVALNWWGAPLAGGCVGFSTLRARGSESITFFIFTLIFAQFVIYVLTLAFTTEPVFMLAN